MLSRGIQMLYDADVVCVLSPVPSAAAEKACLRCEHRHPRVDTFSSTALSKCAKG